MERRTLKMQDAKVRQLDGKRYLEGYFSVFNKPYQVFPDWEETIAPGAFRGFLASGQDVKVLWNHNPDIVLGSTAAGTASLREDDVGLFGSVLVNENDQDALNAFARVDRGDVDGCSFGFDVQRQEESWDNGTYITRILEVSPLYEVSPCTFPAYTDTSITARAKITMEAARLRLSHARDNKNKQWREEMLSRLKGETHGIENPEAAQAD